MSVWAVVVAGGGGTRFGGPKQFATIGERPLADWSVSAAQGAADGVVLVLPPGDPHLAARDARGAAAVVAGGESRAASVRAGLAAVPDDATVIVVHDGARPLATTSLFKAVIDAVVSGADGAVPAVACADTLKRVRDQIVTETLARDEVVAVQTPQAFRADVLRAAHATGAEATDDAGLVEALGATVHVVPGEARNLKVTTLADLEILRTMARS